ncbi:hypothetical protein C1H46_042467 [Malus baccata]|uniref:Uncharacterized protein n=1 Tax=Malus baccata TaxID=106549 RepID=A0A540KCP5_MALBA|nr:hypothetical protein C1H46_042467 [Malus baccata]
MEPDKGWFLYLQKNHELFSLNISKLLAWSSLEKARRPSRPDFKLVNASCYPDGSMVPFGTRYMFVGSNPYIVGGQFGCPHPLLGYDYWPNFDVIACDPPTDDPCKSNLPMLSGPKFYPFVITLGNKIYVLSLQYRGYMTETWPALFEVYNPESGKWKILPNPPFVVGKTVTSPAAHHYYALGHKLVVTKTWSVESYAFDTREEKWEPWNSREDPFEIAYKPHPTSARFKDFLVAVHQGDFGDVLTYRLDSYGIPRPGRNLVELENIFLPPLDGCFPFITEINDAGLMSDRLDKHDNKPDVFWKKENLPRLDRELYDAWCSWYWGALKGSSSSSGHTQDGQVPLGLINGYECDIYSFAFAKWGYFVAGSWARVQR